LFDEIEKLTYPEIKEFLIKHVQGGEPIPYEKYFAFAGVRYSPKEIIREFSIGGIGLGTDSARKIVVNTTKDMNDVGKKMGYKDSDELVSLNGQTLNADNLGEVIQKFYDTAKEGDIVKVGVKRKMENGQTELLTLSAPAMKVEKPAVHQLKFDTNATPEQLKLRKVWLNTGE
jgi:predicted metalloprotease with PDZ domain